MAFERLPTETLIDIVKYAGIDGTTSSWLSLASCNRTLNRIVTPMLYLNFTEAGRKSVPKLLRTVLANTQLATYVRRYTGPGFPNREFLDVSELAQADFAACQERMNAFQETLKGTGAALEGIENWMPRIRQGRWHAVTSMLFLLLPNLEGIEMIDYRHDEEGDMAHALGIAARLQGSGISAQYSLEHLTDVSLSPFAQPDVAEADDPLGFYLWPESEYLHFSDVMPFLRLPSVQSVAVSRLAVDNARDRRPVFSPENCQFSTKELEITSSCLEAWWLIEFLRLFTSLRKFSYNHVAREDEVPEVLPQEIRQAIAHLLPCLEELEISEACKENGERTTVREIGSLAEFERLKSIDVDWSTLFGFPSGEDGSMPAVRLCEVLPRALERLILRHSVGLCYEENLRELLWVVEERFPELKRIEMRGSHRNDSGALTRDFKAKGVELLIHPLKCDFGTKKVIFE
jgi:hypothetical protein